VVQPYTLKNCEKIYCHFKLLRYDSLHEGIIMWIKLLLATEAVIAMAFIVKGELTNRRRRYNYENGKPFYIAGLTALGIFVSSSIVWFAS
jgi:hypothetical protein